MSQKTVVWLAALTTAAFFMVSGCSTEIVGNSFENGGSAKTVGVYSVLDFGAKGDGITNDAAAIQKAIDACFQAGGGQVLLPGGKTYYSGTIVLKANIDLHIAKGAMLKGSEDPNDFVVIPWEDGSKVPTFILAEKAENVTISGDGIIDGSGYTYMRDEGEFGYRPKRYHRPLMLYTLACEHLTIRDVTWQNAPFWTLHLTACKDVLIEGIRILNDLKIPNCDGIDPDHCQNVRIANCYIIAGDDAIVLKNSRPYMDYGACENITITGCTLVSASSAFKVGTASFGDFRNIVMDNCVIYGSHRGISIQARDEGDVENFLFSNIVIETQRFQQMWWGSAEPIYVTYLPRNAETKIGTVRNIRFSNIHCKSENGVFIHGWEGKPIENIVLDNVQVEIGKWTQWPGGWYDTRPSVIPRVSEKNSAGIYCKWAKDVTLRNTNVRWLGEPAEFFGSALEVHNTEGLNIEGFTGKSAHPDKYPDKVIE